MPMVARETLKINARVLVYKYKLLGNGKGDVYEGRCGKEIVAVKEIFKPGDAGEEEEGRQHKLLEHKPHRNVVGYLCVQETAHFRYLVLELCQGSLGDDGVIRDLIGEIGTKELLRQIADGVGHLHSLDIQHCDLRPSKILISLPDTHGKRRAVISDFGSSSCNTSPDTSPWRAPELRNPDSQRPVGLAADVFSMGCIFYFILTRGNHPFRADKDQANTQAEASILGRKGDRDRLIEWADYNNCGDSSDDHCAGSADDADRKEQCNWSGHEAGDLIPSMIDQEPIRRTTADGVLGHPFFWTSKRRLEFFQLVSDHVQQERDKPESTSLLTPLENGASNIIGDNWLAKLDTDDFSATLQQPPEGQQIYDPTKLEHLLRAIRNTDHYLGHLEPATQARKGRSSPEILFYFTDKFPCLLMHVYSVIGEARNREVGVWEELDLRDFYISFATAVSTRPQVQKEDRVQDPGQGNLYLWMAGLCIMSLGF